MEEKGQEASVTLRLNRAEHSSRSEHRANYILERGVWHATCRVCGFRVSDAVRQRAAAVYREHIKEERAAVKPVWLDLREDPTPSVPR